jgi:hypothetical protein
MSVKIQHSSIPGILREKHRHDLAYLVECIIGAGIDPAGIEQLGKDIKHGYTMIKLPESMTAEFAQSFLPMIGTEEQVLKLRGCPAAGEGTRYIIGFLRQ